MHFLICSCTQPNTICNRYCMIQPITKCWKIQVKFKNESFPEVLPLGYFVANKESYFSRFESCGSGSVFADLWKGTVKPYLDKESVRFQPPGGEDSTCTASPSLRYQISKKRKSSTTPPAIHLATKVARRQLVTSSTCDDCDEKEMDKQIQKIS